jgi:single-strand DNA-binding protein
MAEGLNRVMLLGNLGQEPELRYTPSGQAVLNLRIATTESYIDRDRARKERTDWHTVVVWGKRAEALSKILHKGTSIFVEGSLRTSSFEGRDGQKRYKTEVTARNLLLTGGGGGGRRSSGPADDYEPASEGYGGGGGGGGYGGPPDQGGGGGGGGGGPDYGDDDDIPF